MTPEQLASIRARLDAATPGPWQAHLSNTPPHYLATPVVSHKCGPAGDRLGRFVLWDGDPEQADKDALLIANAPADLAALLAYIGQLEGLLADLCEDGRAAAEAVRLRRAVSAVVALADKAEAAPDCPPQSLSVYRTVVCALYNALAPPS